MIIDGRMLDKNFFASGCSRYISEMLQVIRMNESGIEICFLESSFSRREIKPDVLLTIGGIPSPLIRKLPVPSLLWLPGMEEKDFSKKRYFQRFRRKLPGVYKQAKYILVDSEKNKNILLQQESLPHSEIIVIPHVGDENCYPSLLGEKERLKMQYAGGKDYFLVIQTDSLILYGMELMKAFSQFKKRQGSGMQLVIAGISGKADRKFLKKLDSFKYRNEIHIYNNLDEPELKKIISSAYILLQTVEDMDMMLNAFRMDVPVLLNEKNGQHEATGAALKTRFDNYAELAGQLSLLYTNEYFRNELIEKARAIAAKSSRENQVKQFWNAVRMAMERN